MLVALTGPQSSGKSTLIEAIKEWSINTKYNFIYKPSATRILKSKGFTINNIGDNFDNTQREVILSHINNILDYREKGGDVILDRCILDGVVYTNYFYKQGKVSDQVMSYADKAIKAYYPEYDRVFYLDPTGVPLVDDNERSTDVIFRKDIISIFEKYIEIYPVIKLTGSIENRLNTIARYL